MELQPIIPFEPVKTEQIPVGPEWIAQVKWDGIRMLAYCSNEQVRLVNRRLHDRTLQYPELLQPWVYCSASSFILDGELVAFDGGKPSFHEIMKRDSLRRQQAITQAVSRVPVVYMVFDVLLTDDRWVTELPLSQRQALLQDMIKPDQQLVQPVQSFPDGDALFRAVSEQQLEGVVLKRLDGAYLINGKDKRWMKRKISRDLYAVIGGVTFRDKVVNSLLLGLYTPKGQLMYIGHAGTGQLTIQDWSSLTERVKPLALSTIPFNAKPPLLRETIWVKPQLVVKVDFLEWTPGGTMRHPSIESIVEHMAPAECTIEQIK
ncbi:DNA ligase [Paenibacillus sp. P96]|uniref:DNA ligase (ATP) n=1 Tax=Paenibacillus zeirhizosphaerae TaxID=2987519 RepID=A0ABT9FXB4_9BACL|nr:RNA ligase family protein [Paenibacillus sp. P96]MDP4099275.1 DNA ligase [Paenibacillus sp. P96]